MLLGRPFLENYYIIFNLNTTLTSVGIVQAEYTKRNGLNVGSSVFLLILFIILIGALVGGYKEWEQYKFEAGVTRAKEDEMRAILSPRSRKILGLDLPSGAAH